MKLTRTGNSFTAAKRAHAGCTRVRSCNEITKPRARERVYRERVRQQINDKRKETILPRASRKKKTEKKRSKMWSLAVSKCGSQQGRRRAPFLMFLLDLNTARKEEEEGEGEREEKKNRGESRIWMLLFRWSKSVTSHPPAVNKVYCIALTETSRSTSAVGWRSVGPFLRGNAMTCVRF